MREILFRGKRIDNDEWVYGDLRSWQTGCFGIRNYSMSKAFIVHPETIGQYTGFNDSKPWDNLQKRQKTNYFWKTKGAAWNGTPIFEGDIVKIDNRKYTVSFEKGCWVILGKSEFWDFLQTNVKSCEVIGNIHDNPELLEVNGDD